MKKFGDRAPNAHPQQQLNLVHRNKMSKIIIENWQNTTQSLPMKRVSYPVIASI